jgi:DUF1009 family protein
MGEPAGSGDKKKIGIIAGKGQLPAIIAADARSKGFHIYTAALKGLTEGTEREYSEESEVLNAGKLGSFFKFFKGHGVTEVLFAGKVPKTSLYDGTVIPDLRAVGVLTKLADRGDDTIMNTIVSEFKKEGIDFLDMRNFCSDLLTPEGALTKKGPSRKEKGDMEFGFRMAKEIGSLDIGQTVVVKDLAVMSVEAIEGTDEAIRRGGELSGGGAVVVKVSRPGQDMRFDVPVVGLDTLKVMEEVGARVLAVEAGKSILLGRGEFIERAEGAGITVAGVAG